MDFNDGLVHYAQVALRDLTNYYSGMLKIPGPSCSHVPKAC